MATLISIFYWGGFLRWEKSEEGLQARTAQAYARIESRVSTKSATVAHLAPSSLYLLSASIPPEICS